MVEKSLEAWRYCHSFPIKISCVSVLEDSRNLVVEYILLGSNSYGSLIKFSKTSISHTPLQLHNSFIFNNTSLSAFPSPPRPYFCQHNLIPTIIHNKKEHAIISCNTLCATRLQARQRSNLITKHVHYTILPSLRSSIEQ